MDEVIVPKIGPKVVPGGGVNEAGGSSVVARVGADGVVSCSDVVVAKCLVIELRHHYGSALTRKINFGGVETVSRAGTGSPMSGGCWPSSTTAIAASPFIVAVPEANISWSCLDGRRE